MAMAYVRPVLCRLCRFPALDGSVPVSEIDGEKLSEWCLRMMDTELDEEGLEKAVFCQLCMSEAIFEHINSVTAGGKTVHSGWWHTAKILNWEKFYLDILRGEELQPCSVQMVSVSAKQIKDHLLRRKSPVDPDLLRKDKVKKVYKCFYCPEEFSSKLRLKNHATQTHRDSPIFSCNLCSRIFKCKTEKSAHFEKVHRDKLICVYCGAHFKKLFKYRSHMQKGHNKEEIQCKKNKQCGLFVQTEAEVEEHSMTTEQESNATEIQCIYSPPKISTPIALEHKSEAIRCDSGTVCPSDLLSKEKKQTVFEDEHLSIRRVYCKKIVTSAEGGIKSRTKKHHPSLANIRRNFNQNCPTFFLTEEEQHIRDGHEAQLLTILKCVHCSKMYTDYRSLNSHVKIKHSEVMIKCKWRGCHRFCLSHLELEQHFQEEHRANKEQKTSQMCSFKTSRQMNLQQQILTLHGVGRLQCSLCPKAFKSRIWLSRHMHRVHSNIPRQCWVCLEKCNNIESHLAIRKCLHCAFLANCSSEYVQHQQICAKKHKCQFCKDTFNYKSVRDAHVLKEHANADKRSISRTLLTVTIEEC